MALPLMRKYYSDVSYQWQTDILVPLTPLSARLTRHYFEDLNTHPSGEVVEVASVGIRVDENASPYHVFPLNMNVTPLEMESMRQFFMDGGFWFYPDSDVNEGFLVAYFPSEFSPIPLSNGRFIIQGELAQIGYGAPPRIPNQELVPLVVPPLRIQHQFRANAALSGPNNTQYCTFPRPESSESDWSLLDAHIIRHETRYVDRYDRVLFNWVRRVKRLYHLIFEAVTLDFIETLLECTGQRKLRFYPNIGSDVDLSMPVDIDRSQAYINVRVIESQLDIRNDKSLYTTSVTLEEI